MSALPARPLPSLTPLPGGKVLYGRFSNHVHNGAWGETLPGGFDNVPGGMPYSFVGALGVRTDADTGLAYMRQRSYDSTLQRFISRDQLHTQNRYEYADGSPTVFVDVDGRRLFQLHPSRLLVEAT